MITFKNKNKCIYMHNIGILEYKFFIKVTFILRSDFHLYLELRH